MKSRDILLLLLIINSIIVYCFTKNILYSTIDIFLAIGIYFANYIILRKFADQ